MAASILIGLALIAISIVIGSAMIVLCFDVLGRIDDGRLRVNHWLSKVLLLTGITSWLVIGVIFVSLIWTGVFILQGSFDRFEPAFYFSLISITTVGYGDVLLTQETRILGGFLAADGFILFGLDTAFLFEVLNRLKTAGSEKHYEA